MALKKENNYFTIFLVEDDRWYIEILEYHLALNPDFLIEKYSSAQDCLHNLHKKPSVICVDYSLPDMNGKDLTRKIKAHNPEIPIVIISGQNDIKIAIELLGEHNVADYIVKDDDTKERLWKSIINIKEKKELEGEVAHLREELGRKFDFNNTIIGNSDAIQKVFKLMQKACDNNITVSITGETGTGKELVANCIHYNSNRAKQPFVAINMTAIPKELIESELFGHEKGAFTGAQVRRIGKFEEANKGTIFLDEIADMEFSMQTKLLRVLQEREVVRIGGNNPTKLDVRIIVATHKNLFDEVKKGNFREDLYYRLLGLSIELPPLRERKDDILILAKFFSDNFANVNKKPKKKFDESAKSKLLKYHYPGNIREMKAIIELAMVMSESDYISAEDITFHSNDSLSDMLKTENSLKNYTAMILRHYLEKYNNDITLVAQKLDMGKSTLYRMVKNGEI